MDETKTHYYPFNLTSSEVACDHSGFSAVLRWLCERGRGEELVTSIPNED